MVAAPKRSLAYPIPTQSYFDVTGRTRANSMFTVSTDILRVSGYTQQFKNLLSARSRRESGPGALVQHSATEEKCNGDVRFSNVVDNAATGDAAAAKGGSSYAQKLKRRKSGYGITITSDSTAKMRCRQRKQLFIRRNKVCDLSLLLGLLGLILVVIDSELTALTIATKDSPTSLFLRSLCVLSTVALCLSLINYHRIEVKIALIDSGADDWRVAITGERIVKLSIELAVCAICPFPGSGQMNWPYIKPENQQIQMLPVPVDVLLSVPMFLRAYLLCRFMVLHSKQFQDAATRSIAALNRISMDFRFVIKTMMSDHPLTVLVIFTVSFWICMSWMFTQCERYRNKVGAEHYYLNSLWFIMVTFMSIGYGDIVPSTYCGRMLSISTGIVGAGVSSALIAVISRKLELSRAEKHVNNFMADSKLTNQRKNAAAAVLQHTWFIHKYQNGSARGNDLRLRQHQRKFLNSINEFRRIKWDQRKLQEKGNSLLDVGKMHNEMHETMWEMHRSHEQLVTHMDTLTQRVNDMYTLLYSHCQHQGQPIAAHLQPVPLASQSPVPQSPPVLMANNRRPQSPLSPGGGSCGCSRYTPNPFRMPPTSTASSTAPSTGPPSASTLRVPSSSASVISQNTLVSARSSGTPVVNGGTLTHNDSSERYSLRSSPPGSGKETTNSHIRQNSSQDYESEDVSATSPLIAHEPV